MRYNYIGYQLIVLNIKEKMKYIFHFVDGRRNIYEIANEMLELVEYIDSSDIMIVKRSVDSKPEIVNFKHVIRIEEFIEIPDMD